MMIIDEYNNLRRYGDHLVIKIRVINKNFNDVGLYDSIVKNCRTWLRDAQYKGLL